MNTLETRLEELTLLKNDRYILFELMRWINFVYGLRVTSLAALNLFFEEQNLGYEVKMRIDTTRFVEKEGKMVLNNYFDRKYYEIKKRAK